MASPRTRVPAATAVPPTHWSMQQSVDGFPEPFYGLSGHSEVRTVVLVPDAEEQNWDQYS